MKQIRQTAWSRDKRFGGRLVFVAMIHLRALVEITYALSTIVIPMSENLDRYRVRDFRPRLEYRLAWKSVLKENKLRPERALKLAIDALAEQVNLPKREIPQLETGSSCRDGFSTRR